jgi:hypothetical protein
VLHDLKIRKAVMQFFHKKKKTTKDFFSKIKL